MPTIDEISVLRNDSDIVEKFGEIIALKFTPGDGYQIWIQNKQDNVPK